MVRRLFIVSSLALFLLGPGGLAAQDDDDFVPDVQAESFLDVSVELKAGFRWSEEDRFPLFTPFPPEFIPAGEDNVALSTVAPGSSIEINKATVYFDIELPRRITGRIKIDFIDLYDRNPTSTDKKIDVDEAWIAFGPRQQSLAPIQGTSFYALLGKAHKFEKQRARRTESYGLVSTAFNRFPDLMLQGGGSLGSNVYFFGQVSDGNPVFMRDPNALAGDNGVNLPPNPDLRLGLGFPIFYHAEVEDLQIDDHLEYGGGGGFRWLSEDQRLGVDVLGFFYQMTLPEATPLNGTNYQADLELLAGAGIPPDQLEGNERTEYGANMDLKLGDFAAFAQYVQEESANLPRTGFEVEVAYTFVTGDQGDPTALFTSFQPVFRYSRLTNDWTAPRIFITLSALWDWQKYDFGLRTTIIDKVDLTLEYSHNDIAAARPIGHDEFLATMRLFF